MTFAETAREYMEIVVVEMADREFDLQADMDCALSKEGNSLSKIAQVLQVVPDEVLELVSRKTQLNKDVVEVIFNSLDAGITINELGPLLPVHFQEYFVPELFQSELPVPQAANFIGASEIEPIQVDEDELVSITHKTTVNAELPVKRLRSREESPAVRKRLPRRREPTGGIEPSKYIAT
mmetsp:Transcript_33961/g.59185  ORF Transcript_33961/g.59185 Transcript_33961/m.59185 type:complete len:180 (-) Transcript_33961:25-564(-)